MLHRMLTLNPLYITFLHLYSLFFNLCSLYFFPFLLMHWTSSTIRMVQPMTIDYELLAPTNQRNLSKRQLLLQCQYSTLRECKQACKTIDCGGPGQPMTRCQGECVGREDCYSCTTPCDWTGIDALESCDLFCNGECSYLNAWNCYSCECAKQFYTYEIFCEDDCDGAGSCVKASEIYKCPWRCVELAGTVELKMQTIWIVCAVLVVAVFLLGILLSLLCLLCPSCPMNRCFRRQFLHQTGLFSANHVGAVGIGHLYHNNKKQPIVEMFVNSKPTPPRRIINNDQQPDIESPSADFSERYPLTTSTDLHRRILSPRFSLSSGDDSKLLSSTVPDGDLLKDTSSSKYLFLTSSHINQYANPETPPQQHQQPSNHNNDNNNGGGGGGNFEIKAVQCSIHSSMEELGNIDDNNDANIVVNRNLTPLANHPPLVNKQISNELQSTTQQSAAVPRNNQLAASNLNIILGNNRSDETML